MPPLIRADIFLCQRHCLFNSFCPCLWSFGVEDPFQDASFDRAWEGIEVFFGGFIFGEVFGKVGWNVKGFHTVEYLLFGENNDRVVTDLTPRELEYLTGLTQELVDVSGALQASWTTAPAGGGQSYRDVFATAGQAGNTAYPSLSAAAQEILVGMSAICDEVANGKIADPYDAHDPNLVESQFSFNSQDDFANNLRSVLNAYTGDVIDAGSTGRGLDELVKLTYPGLDARFHLELDDAIAKINAIPRPFRTAITTPASYPAIEAAQAAVRTVQATIDGDLTTEILGAR